MTTQDKIKIIINSQNEIEKRNRVKEEFFKKVVEDSSEDSSKENSFNFKKEATLKDNKTE
jgi:hypothetical protein